MSLLKNGNVTSTDSLMHDPSQCSNSCLTCSPFGRQQLRISTVANQQIDIASKENGHLYPAMRFLPASKQVLFNIFKSPLNLLVCCFLTHMITQCFTFCRMHSQLAEVLQKHDCVYQLAIKTSDFLCPPP